MFRKAMRFPGLMMPVLIIAFLCLLSGCGTGGLADAPAGSSGGGTTGGSTPPVTSEPAGFVNILTSSPQVGSDGLSTVTLTAIVKTANNVALKDKSVAFASNSGTLVVILGTTDASGSATATLSAAPDKSNRTITVTAKADSITSTTSVDVVGTTLQITGQNSLVSGTSAKLSIFLKDSAGTKIPYLNITLTSSLGNSFDQDPVSTDVNGQAEVTYTATVGGTDTVTASALGAIATQTISVSTTDFTFTAPSSGTEINIGNAQTVTIHYALSGVPQTGKTVNFSTTRGTITPLSTVTDGSGNASAVLSSSTAGPATITAAITGTGTIQRPVEFVATTASSMSLQASPGTISTNTAGSTVEQSTIIAVLRDPSGNLVKNKTVRFSLTDVSGGYIKQASDVTNSQGMASTTYISSISPSFKDGVRIDASVDGSAATAFATLTVASKPIYVVFGTGNTIEKYSSTQYRAPFVALVTDIAGNPQAGVTVTANLTPVTYLKGRYTGCTSSSDKYWQWSPATTNNGTYLECVNEDNNPIFFGSHPEWLLNGFLDKEPVPSLITEDINGDGVLTPGNVAEVNRTATTDADGFAQFNVTYAKQFANWVNVKIEGRIYSYGNQTLGTTQFYLPVLRDDVACEVTPPGPISPFGLGAPPNNVCTKNIASETKAPTGVTATALSPTQIRISWTAVAGASGYRVYKNFDPLPLKSVVSTSTVDSGLTADTTYCYAVSSLNASGESDKSSPVCAMTRLAGPSTPTGLTATGSAGPPPKVTLTWKTSGAASYRIYRDGTLIAPTFAGSQATDTTVAAQTWYCYTISAVDASGLESDQSDPACTLTGVLPATPQDLKATGSTAPAAPTITLTWTTYAGAASYKIYRDGTLLLTSAGSQAIDAPVAPLTWYCYAISAVDGSGNESARSESVCEATH